ncbi:MAG: hypothetical protein ACRD3B_19590 [Candidatus Sulfotelmatobacter sp.]
MPGFCVSCGAPVLGAFCNQCGSKTIAPGTMVPGAPVSVVQPVVSAPVPLPVSTPVATPFSTPVQSNPMVAPAPVITTTPPVITPTTQGSGVVKALLWIFLIIVVLFLGVAGVSLYGYYWAKHKITSIASAVTGGVTQETKVLDHGDSCKLLPAADLQRILGVAIEKTAEIMEGSDPGCAYYANPTAYAQLQRAAMAQARKQKPEVARKPGAQPNNPLAMLKDTNQMDGMLKGLGLNGGGNDGRVFKFTIERNFGDSAWSGMRLVESATPGFEDVSGVGDHAMVGSFGHSYFAMKDDTMVRLDTTLVPDGKVRGAAISKKIFGNLN